jgi:poly-beta-1,6-N-acetyl-D-glucosamine synthase
VGYLFFSFGLYEYIVFSVLSFVLLVQLVYYLAIYIRIPNFTKRKPEYASIQEPLSVIICARNEYDNLENHLPIILEQDYPNYEVIVVDDCSVDDTDKLLERLQAKYPHLRTTQIKNDEKFTHGKKLALTIGVKDATHDLLVLTDADCVPNSKNWLASIQRNFTPQTEIVLGYGAYYNVKGFLNKLIRFDTATIAMQYLSFALIGRPYMGVGRNLAYRKSLYTKQKGFAAHYHVLSGDDDLFINAAANRKNTRVEFSKDSHTLSVPKKKFKYWLNQKRRHLSTGNMYKFADKLLLGIEISSRFIFYLSCLLMLVNPASWMLGVAAFMIRLIVQLSVLNGVFKRFNEKKLVFLSILFDIVLPLINAFLYFSNAFNSKQYKWK